MKFPVTSGCCAAALLCFFLSVPPAARANPFQSIGSTLKKAGNALNPFKKSAPKPAAEPAPSTKPKPTVAKSAKPAPVKKKKATSTTAKKTTGGATAKPETKSGPATVAAATAEKPKDETSAGETPGDVPAGDESSTPNDATTPAAATDPPAPTELPFGTPVMGRKGLVRSPYAEDQGMVDVTDLPAGAKVKCPFTGKVFRVP